MYKTLFILFTFSVLSSLAIEHQRLPFKRNLQATGSGSSVSNDGIIPLSGPGNFIVSASLGYNSTTNSSTSSADMILALYTSRSLLARSCMGFTGYQTHQSGVIISQKPSNSSFINFKASGTYMTSSNVVLDSSYWSLNTNGVLATQCSSSPGISYNNTGLLGVIGLGFANNSASNYIGGQPLFSISIDEDGQTGELLFYSNLTKATTNVPLASLQSDSNWHISGLTNMVFNGSNSQSMDISAYQVSFDINSNAIGFPSAIYNTVLQNIQSAGPAITCNSNIYFPTCNYKGNLDNLPVIQIHAGNTMIPLYPEVYIANSSQYTNGEINGPILLNIKAISSNLTGANYVSSLFNNYIIMDVNVLTYFYVVFQGDSSQSTGTISLYIANHDEEALISEGSPVLYIVLGAVIVLLLAGGAYWFFVRRGKLMYDGEREYGTEGRRSLLDDGLHSQL